MMKDAEIKNTPAAETVIVVDTDDLICLVGQKEIKLLNRRKLLNSHIHGVDSHRTRPMTALGAGELLERLAQMESCVRATAALQKQVTDLQESVKSLSEQNIRLDQVSTEARKAQAASERQAADVETAIDLYAENEKLKAELAELKKTPYHRLGICGRCYESVYELFPANCSEKPELLLGQPIGQYHCPDCGAMVIAGLQHFKLCKRCIDRKHPGFDEMRD